MQADLGIQAVADFLGLDPLKGKFLSPHGVVGVPWVFVTEFDGATEFAYKKGDEKPAGDMMIGVDDRGVVGCMMTATFRVSSHTRDGINFHSRAIMPLDALIATYRTCSTCGAADAPYGLSVYGARRREFGIWFCEGHRP